MNAIVQTAEFPMRHLLNVKDYYTLWEMGRLESHVELIEGEIYTMSPIGSHHAGITALLTKILSRACNDVLVNPQNPLHLSEYSEPEPDLCLLKGSGEEYLQRLPTADDVLVLIEVSDSTLKYDLETKATLYAKHAIPVYWVIDLQNKQLIIHRQPENAVYGDIEVLTKEQLMDIEILPDVFISLGEYL